MSAREEPSDLQLAALRVLSDGGITYPSGLAYVLIDRGALRVRNPRGRLKAQGAGFIGGKVLAELSRKGWAYYTPRPRGWSLTVEGRAALARVQGGAA